MARRAHWTAAAIAIGGVVEAIQALPISGQGAWDTVHHVRDLASAASARLQALHGTDRKISDISVLNLDRDAGTVVKRAIGEDGCDYAGFLGAECADDIHTFVVSERDITSELVGQFYPAASDLLPTETLGDLRLIAQGIGWGLTEESGFQNGQTNDRWSYGSRAGSARRSTATGSYSNGGGNDKSGEKTLHLRDIVVAMLFMWQTWLVVAVLLGMSVLAQLNRR